VRKYFYRKLIFRLHQILAQNFVRISTNTPSEVTVEIFDTKGESISAKKFYGELTWDLLTANGSKAGAGMYVIKASGYDVDNNYFSKEQNLIIAK